MILRNRLKELIAVKERQEHRRITQRTIAAETGLALVTVSKYSQNEITLLDTASLTKLCKYLNCTIGDLLVFEDEPAENSHGSELALAGV